MTDSPDSPDAPDAHDATDRSNAAVEVSPAPRRLLTGDRLCVGCGYNLVNQPIVKEPHYGLMIARCPECGEAAALQEYPLLGRWVGRLVGLGAALWAIALLACIVVSGGLMFAGGMTAWTRGWDPAGDELEAIHRRALPPTEPGNPFGTTTQVDFSAWFVAQDRGALHRQIVAGVSDVYTVGGAALESLFFAPATFAIGVVISLLLMHRRIGGRIATACLGVAIAAGILGWVYRIIGTSSLWVGDAAFLVTGWRVVLNGILINGVALIAGAVFGRPVTRALVRLGVPPRLRGALAFLWLVDDRPLPPGINRVRGPRVR